MLIGFAASGQLSVNYVVGELVPVRHRFVASGIMSVISYPISGLGPYFSRLFIANTVAGWRWNYYMTTILSKMEISLDCYSNADYIRWNCVDSIPCILPSASIRRVTQGAHKNARNERV